MSGWLAVCYKASRSFYVPTRSLLLPQKYIYGQYPQPFPEHVSTADSIYSVMASITYPALSLSVSLFLSSPTVASLYVDFS